MSAVDVRLECEQMCCACVVAFRCASNGYLIDLIYVLLSIECAFERRST